MVAIVPVDIVVEVAELVVVLAVVEAEAVVVVLPVRNSGSSCGRFRWSSGASGSNSNDNIRRCRRRTANSPPRDPHHRGVYRVRPVRSHTRHRDFQSRRHRTFTSYSIMRA